MNAIRFAYISLLFLLCLSFLGGCTSTYISRPANAPGRPSISNDPTSPGPVQGVGVESQDIISVVDRVMRDILANPELAGRKTPPRVVVDSRYFRNESTSIIDVNLLTDRLRTELNRAANGRMVFLGRQYADMNEEERALEQEGVVTGGTQGPTQKALGWDYRLGGRITSLDSQDTRTRLISRYHQITFEMLERGTQRIVWNATYEFKKSAQDDIRYR